MKDNPEILIIRQSAFGDILHVLPALAGLKKAFPASRTYLMVKKRFKPLALRAPFVDEVWTSLEKPVDVVVDCQGLLRTAWTTFSSRAPVKAGYSWGEVREKPAAVFYNRRICVYEQHIIDKHAGLLSQALGIDVNVDRNYRADFLVREDPEVAGFLSTVSGPRVIVHPTSSQKRKYLRAGEWVPALQLLIERGFKILLSCGPGEDNKLEPWRKAIPAAVDVPLFPLESLAALLSGCRLLLGSDTGITHLADQLGIPVLSWFSLWPPERNGPYFSPNLVFYRRPPDTEEVARWFDEVIY